MFEILIVLALYGVYKIIREIISQRKCPEDRDLRKVVLGITKKNTETADKIIMHLGICEKCQERAREIGSE